MSDAQRKRFGTVVSELMDTNPDLAVVLAEIGVDRFLPAYAKYPHRVINVGIREQLLINVAAGMALEGMRTVAHTFAPFLIERAFEQVKLGFSHQGVGGVLVSWGAPYESPAYGRTHLTAGDVALIATLPDWRIHIPGHAGEAELLLRDAIASDDAVYIRLSAQENAAQTTFEAGELAVAREGTSGGLTAVAVGPMLDAVLEATADLDATVLYASTVLPLDVEGLRAATSGTDVVLVEPCVEGTSTAQIAQALSDRPHRLLSIGVPRVEQRHYGSAERHDAAFGLDAAGLRGRIGAWVG